MTASEEDIAKKKSELMLQFLNDEWTVKLGELRRCIDNSYSAYSSMKEQTTNSEAEAVDILSDAMKSEKQTDLVACLNKAKTTIQEMLDEWETGTSSSTPTIG